MMARALPEWTGKTPDSRPPPHVRLRIFERYRGRCHWSGRVIRPGDQWDVDHVIALINGGTNSEGNMAPILRGKPHKEKTAQDVEEKSRVYRKAAKHVGIKLRKGRPMPGSRASGLRKRFDGTVERRQQ